LDKGPKILRAVIGRIIPADQDPGALELGADLYVMARLLENEPLAQSIRHGLAQLDAAAKTRFGSAFDQLSGDDQDGLIAAQPQAKWFASLAELTAEGFYADPANGGNRDALSWRMIGYEHRLPDGPNGPKPKAGHAP
jgi:Gluconate 2-dehydrogenase subunit 3